MDLNTRTLHIEMHAKTDLAMAQSAVVRVLDANLRHALVADDALIKDRGHFASVWQVLEGESPSSTAIHLYRSQFELSGSLLEFRLVSSRPPDILKCPRHRKLDPIRWRLSVYVPTFYTKRG